MSDRFRPAMRMAVGDFGLGPSANSQRRIAGPRGLLGVGRDRGSLKAGTGDHEFRWITRICLAGVVRLSLALR
jgi:hypothetical protein